MDPSVASLEEMAFRAWPAEEVELRDGWRLRACRGVTRRANSVWPNGASDAPDRDVEARIAFAEDWYAARDLPPTFQLSPASVPSDLDARLALRGYVVDAPVAVETVDFGSFRMAGQPPQIATSVAGAPSDDWLGLTVDRGRFADVREPYLGLLGRIVQHATAGFALAKWKGKPVAAGLAVLDGPWMGIFGMLTVPEARRRRAATAVLGALVGWGSGRGAASAYLQVELDNAPALALYRAAGFAESHRYHYRIRQPSR